MNIVRFLKLKEVCDELIVSDEYEKYFLNLLKTCRQEHNPRSTKYEVLHYLLFAHYYHTTYHVFYINLKSVQVLYADKFRKDFNSYDIKMIIHNFFVKNDLVITIEDSTTGW